MIFTDFIICDDIRLEATGQNTLIGVYHDSIVFNVSPSEKDIWPKNLSVAIFARVLLGEEDKTKNISKLELFVTLGELKTSIGKIEVERSKVNKSNRIAIVVTLKNFPFEKEGSMSMYLNGYNENDEMVVGVNAPTSIMVKEMVVNHQNQ